MQKDCEITLPVQACDCHVHVVGAVPTYPMLADRQYTPGPASVEDLRLHMAHTGVQRTVIVQPSFYGTDNRCTLDALDELEGAGRGVVVVDRTISEAALHSMHERRIRGIRLNIESSHQGPPPDLARAIAPWLARLRPLGWHVQVFASLDLIAAAAPSLSDLSVPLVLDHFAMVPDDCSEDDPRLKSLLQLLRQGQTWIKLSAPYRQPISQPISQPICQPTCQPKGKPADPPGNKTQSGAKMTPERLAQRFIEARPDRLLWASDWPHTQRQPGKAATEPSAYRDIPADSLRSQIGLWMNERALQQQILVDNPANLYGF